MPFIKIIDYPEANGELKEIYNHLLATRGKLADVHKIQSLNAPTILSHMNLYKDIMFGQSPLKRNQREMIAIVVSAVNRCEYCITHHREALYHYWKDYQKIDLLTRHPEAAELSEADMALCQYARDLTTNMELFDEERITSLRAVGFDDRAILDATLVISYFNFVNRMALALGLDIRDDEVRGYKY